MTNLLKLDLVNIYTVKIFVVFFVIILMLISCNQNEERINVNPSIKSDFSKDFLNECEKAFNRIEFEEIKSFQDVPLVCNCVLEKLLDYYSIKDLDSIYMVALKGENYHKQAQIFFNETYNVIGKECFKKFITDSTKNILIQNEDEREVIIDHFKLLMYNSMSKQEIKDFEKTYNVDQYVNCIIEKLLKNYSYDQLINEKYSDDELMLIGKGCINSKEVLKANKNLSINEIIDLLKTNEIEDYIISNLGGKLDKLDKINIESEILVTKVYSVTSFSMLNGVANGIGLYFSENKLKQFEVIFNEKLGFSKEIKDLKELSFFYSNNYIQNGKSYISYMYLYKDYVVSYSTSIENDRIIMFGITSKPFMSKLYGIEF